MRTFVVHYHFCGAQGRRVYRWCLVRLDDLPRSQCLERLKSAVRAQTDRRPVTLVEYREI